MIQWLRKRFTYIAYITMFGVIVYFPIITQRLTNPDGLLYSTINHGRPHSWEAAQGRIGLTLWDWLKNDYVFPWISTVFCIILMAVISALVVDLFECGECWPAKLLIPVLLLLSPNVSNLFTYYYCSDSYTFAYLLSVFAVYLLAHKKKKSDWLLSALMIMISLTLYQAYIGVSISLCLFYLLFLLLDSKNDWTNIREFLTKSILAGLTGVVGYLVLFKTVTAVLGIEAENLRGFDNMGRLPIADIPRLAENAFTAVWQYFFTNDIINNAWRSRGYVNFFLLVLVFLLLLGNVMIRKHYLEKWRILLIIVSILLLPAALGCIVIIAPGASIYAETGLLMLPQMNFWYVFVTVAVLDTFSQEGFALKRLVLFALLPLCYIALTLILYTGIFQTCLRTNLEKSYQLGTRILQSMDALPEYKKGMPVLIAGKAEKGNYPRVNSYLYEVTDGSVANYGLFWENPWDQQLCWAAFFEQYFDVHFEICEESWMQGVMASEYYENMNIFPENGAVQIIEDVVVVKLSGK